MTRLALLIATVCMIWVTLAPKLCVAQATSNSYSSIWSKTLDTAGGKASRDTVVIYLHGRSGNVMDDATVPLVVQLLADRLGAGLARIIRPPALDGAPNDPAIMDFIRVRARELRNAGVQRVLLAGASRGGWLAIKGGHEISEIDEVFAVAPATYGLSAPELEAQATAINAMLSSMQARRISLFFFKNDPREAVASKRGDTARTALQKLPASFLIEDQPEGLPGHGAISMGRFGRRYLDCLTQFFSAKTLPRGEQHCDTSAGYAVGAEIKFPKVVPAVPRDVTAAPIRPFAGRWEGDDEYGRYWILASTEFSENGVTFLFGHSPAPGNVSVKPWIQELKFVQSKSDPDVLEHVSNRMKVTFSVLLVHGTDLELKTKFQGDSRTYAPMVLTARPSAQ